VICAAVRAGRRPQTALHYVGGTVGLHKIRA